MKKAAIKDQLYGGIVEMMHNRTLFHRSDIGAKHEYSRWSDEGQQELLDFVQEISRKILVAEDAELDRRAKDMVIKTIKDPQK